MNAIDVAALQATAQILEGMGCTKEEAEQKVLESAQRLGIIRTFTPVYCQHSPGIVTHFKEKGMAGIHKSLHGAIDCDDENGSYSALKVMKSAAGYYVGREFHEKGSNFTEPGIRESGYYGTHEEAAAALRDNSFEWLAAIENVAFYESNGYNIETGERTTPA